MSTDSRQNTVETALAASTVTELMEVLWGRGRAVASAPVSPSQLKVLFVLEEEDGVSLRNVTERLGSTPPSTSRLCDRLQAVGFINRTASPNSRRELRLWLSESGRLFLRELRSRREFELHKVIDQMSPRSRAMLLEGLSAFRDAADHTRTGGADLEPSRTA